MVSTRACGALSSSSNLDRHTDYFRYVNKDFQEDPSIRWNWYTLGMEQSPSYHPIEQQNFSKELDLTLQKIEETLTLSEEEQKEFIQTRLNELEEKSEKVRELSMWGNRLHKGYISKETGIQRNMMVDPFYVDDPSLFESFLAIYKQFRNTPGWSSIPPRQILMNVVQFTLQHYFGNMFSVSGTEAKNVNFYLNEEHQDNHISIADFKRKNMAVCAEKASAAQNILSFVGVDTFAVLSGNCKLAGEEEGNAHMFNIFNFGKGYRIYDPTNPVLQMDKDGKIIGASSAFYPITDKDFEELTSNGEVEVEHKDNQIDEEGNREEVITKRIYGGVPKKTS
jgi:hypothetical protein